eukprot:FR739834.1.p1 GENE.FR739834.1~~FR739834.1.p1  ORF type:complete len:323 (+),score=47.36 FR739834.1:59-970(+)
MAQIFKQAGDKAVRHITKISDLSRAEITSVISLACDMKMNMSDYHDALKHKTLLMLFEKPSLRTRVSLETGMTQLGGHGIAYMTGDSPIGKKETYEDTGMVLSRMVDAVTARVNSREQIAGLCGSSTIPIVNALDDYAHPMQMLADLQTITEVKASLDLSGVRLAYAGDACNNVTYDLMRAGIIMGMDVRVTAPPTPDFLPEASVLAECKELEAVPGAGTARIFESAEEAVEGADVIYTDSWMSYGISGEERDERLAALMPYQVTSSLMAYASKTAVFMNCLPAMRGEEQTAKVIDGPESILF